MEIKVSKNGITVSKDRPIGGGLHIGLALVSGPRRNTVRRLDARAMVGQVEFIVMVLDLFVWRPSYQEKCGWRFWRRWGRAHWCVGPKVRRFAFESAMLDEDENTMSTSFFWVAPHLQPQEAPQVPRASWVDTERCHFSVAKDVSRNDALIEAFASMRDALRRDSPYVLRQIAFGRGSEDGEFHELELGAVIRMLAALDHAVESGGDPYTRVHSWTTTGREVATGETDEDGRDSWVSVQLHPLLRPIHISGPEARFADR